VQGLLWLGASGDAVQDVLQASAEFASSECFVGTVMEYQT